MLCVCCGPLYLGQPVWVIGMPDYTGNLFGMNRYSVKSLRPQRDLVKEGAMPGKNISERWYCSAPIRAKGYDEGRILGHRCRTGEAEGRAGTLGFASKFWFASKCSGMCNSALVCLCAGLTQE